MRYFDHDVTASDDDRIMALRLECGGAAVDAYWAVLELIYRTETHLVFSENRPETKSLCHRLCTDAETLGSWLSSMAEIGLLNRSEGDVENAVEYVSQRAMCNIAGYVSRQETARENGKKGGRKPTANRAGTKSVPKQKPTANRQQTEPLAKEKEKEKSLVTHKGLPNDDASGGAAAAKAAPPPACPLCGTRLWRDHLGSWHCDTCCETYDAGKVAAWTA